MSNGLYYEQDDDPVEREIGRNGWKRSALGGSLASQVSRVRRRMSWMTVGALLVISSSGRTCQDAFSCMIYFRFYLFPVN